MSRAVMQQALEALESYSRWAVTIETEMQKLNAIEALRDALAEQPQPVGLDAVYKTIVRWDEEGIHSRAALARRIVALYTTPAPQPLTDADIRAIAKQGAWDDSYQSLKFARAVEAEVLKRMGVQR